MSNEIITSTGQLGPDFGRSEGRAYYNYEHPIHSTFELRHVFQQFRSAAELQGRRRVVFRARCSRECIERVISLENEAQQRGESLFPIEVVIPLNTINPDNDDCLLMLGENVHVSDIPEWGGVYQYWQSSNGSSMQPLDRVQSIDFNQFFLSDQLNESDADRLAQIWQPFGWTRNGVSAFIQAQEDHFTGWFSGARERENGQLVSACMGEGLRLAGAYIVEGTEYGTLSGYEGNGLCTAVVSLLHAQVLNDTLYTTGNTPLIVSEFNMTSRSDIVGRHAGMTIPLVEGTSGLEDSPIQVLRRNVSVLDRYPANTTISWRDLGEARSTYRDAYRTTFGFWRNFIVGLLSRESIEKNYSQSQVTEMLSRIEKGVEQ